MRHSPLVFVFAFDFTFDFILTLPNFITSLLHYFVVTTFSRDRLSNGYFITSEIV